MTIKLLLMVPLNTLLVCDVITVHVSPLQKLQQMA